jgi:FMN phosphatase YigB (HAD superfamily)
MKRKKNEKRLEWIFFGLNQVLINPDKLCFNVYQLLQRYLRVHGIQLSFDEILATREDLILGHDDEVPYLSIARMYLSKSDYQNWHRQVHDFYRERMQKDLVLIPGMDDLIRQLSKQYSLGIIADQPQEILQFLDRKRLLAYFKIHAISGIVRMNKPRKKLFEWAVNQAGSSFERCLMSGYRLNEDIIPAKQLDMMTIQTRWDIDKKGYQPKASKPLQYLSSLQRIEMWSLEPGKSDTAPDEIVTSVRQLHSAIQQFDS